MDLLDFDSIKQYVDFSPETARVLRDFHPIAEPHFEPIVDDFYDAIETHARARQVITGGRAQIERLKRTLVRWLDSTLLGPYDTTYLETHARIGRVHVRISLPQEFMFTAMNRIRVRLVDVAHHAHANDLPRQLATLRAIDKVLDLELAIMLDTYRVHLEERLRANERLATIGQLSASIGHELRNPLGIMESSLFLIDQRLKNQGVLDEQVAKHVAKVRGQIKVCGKTITDLLDLARSQPPRKAQVQVLDLVKQALEQTELASGVRVVRQVPADLTLHADRDQLSQVVSNLLSNANQALHGKGTIELFAEGADGGVALTVKDDGPGVPPDERPRIFDALYTTKSNGTGLGLALCRRIAEAHGGDIALEPSEVGAAFRVWLPDVEADAVR